MTYFFIFASSRKQFEQLPQVEKNAMALRYFKDHRPSLMPPVVDFIAVDTDDSDEDDDKEEASGTAPATSQQIFQAKNMFRCGICQEGKITTESDKWECANPDCTQIFCDACYTKRNDNQFCSRMCANARVTPPADPNSSVAGGSSSSSGSSSSTSTTSTILFASQGHLFFHLC